MSNNSLRKLIKLAEKGDVNAQNDLAAMMATGDCVEKDLEMAAYWYKQAADQESPNAIFNLALMYLLGEGVEKDVQKAVHMLNRAASYGYADAHLVLGEAYCEGNLEFEVNYPKAIEHFLQAARLGSSKGIRCIGYLLAENKVEVNSLATIMKGFSLRNP